jgi:hypothetical protein
MKRGMLSNHGRRTPIDFGERLHAVVPAYAIAEELKSHLQNCDDRGVPYMTQIYFAKRGLEMLIATRWMDKEKTLRRTLCGLREEWQDMTGEEPPPSIKGIRHPGGVMDDDSKTGREPKPPTH